ncbi:Hypothetical predicted protein [Pelobates cultripes]|uniref:FLYWCH-type domain-containing protein n=1 Tax=Pelobates cultripes TaxID=61616 RepID=A0AAD1WS80_PELCU|nr:Hypothetical predicted protein [Pelobates cultripes]
MTPTIISAIEQGEEPYVRSLHKSDKMEIPINSATDYKVFKVSSEQKIPLEYVKSSKGADLLVVNGCTFRQERIIHGKRIWKCTEYSTVRCNSRCHTLDGVITKGPSEHNHVPDVARLEAKRIIGELKERAANLRLSNEYLMDIVTELLVEWVGLAAPELGRIRESPATTDGMWSSSEGSAHLTRIGTRLLSNRSMPFPLYETTTHPHMAKHPYEQRLL